MNGAADGTDDSEPETAAITVTVDGTVYVQAGGVGRHPEACPEGFSYAGEAELPDTGELCPYYADPERPGQIYVYQSCWDEGTGTTYMAYGPLRGGDNKLTAGGKRKQGRPEGIPSGGLLRMSLSSRQHQQLFPKIPRPWAERPRHQR